MTPGKGLVPWVLLLEQQSYLPYIKKVIKKILQTTGPYTTILKNRLQKALDTIIGDIQSVVKKMEQFYILFVLLARFFLLFNLSNKLKKNFSVISLDFLKDWDFVF